MYIQIVQRSVEIERQIAKDHNSSDTFKKKMVSIENLPSLNKVLLENNNDNKKGKTFFFLSGCFL